ncbi:hypothetical protein HA43_15990 [Pantoea eucrina]|nr:hypothetical protein HA43_15990 [Pantoea eucrina]
MALSAVEVRDLRFQYHLSFTIKTRHGGQIPDGRAWRSPVSALTNANGHEGHQNNAADKNHEFHSKPPQMILRNDSFFLGKSESFSAINPKLAAENSRFRRVNGHFFRPVAFV